MTKKLHPSQKTKKLGRPTQYGPEILDLLKDVPPPVTVTQVCAHLGISSSLFYNWTKKYPDFLSAVTRARSEADDMVESALFRRALGYDYVETTDTQKVDHNGASSTSTVAPKHLPSETGAAKMWLANRRREVWSDKVQVEIVGDHVALLERRIAELEAKDK